MCARPHLRKYCAHNMTNVWSMAVRAVVLTALTFRVNLLAK
jgi:hypothetical protein